MKFCCPPICYPRDIQEKPMYVPENYDISVKRTNFQAVAMVTRIHLNDIIFFSDVDKGYI